MIGWSVRRTRPMSRRTSHKYSMKTSRQGCRVIYVITMFLDEPTNVNGYSQAADGWLLTIFDTLVHLELALSEFSGLDPLDDVLVICFRATF